MCDLTSDDLVRLTCIALERTAFLMAEPSENRHGDPLPPASCFARIDYHGPQNGEVVLAASDGFVRNLAAGLLGADPATVDAETCGIDALRELANIVAGSLICALGGERMPFAVGLPVVCAKESISTTPTVIASLDVEGERLEVYWTTTAAARQAA